MIGDGGSDDQETIGEGVVPPPPAEGPLFVGPPDDPDRYELRDGGTRGGEGRTWRATYRGGLSSPLVEAVKMLFPPAGTDGDWPTDSDLRRWHDNAALLRHLAQPHVVQLHDIFGGDLPHPRGQATGRRSAAYLTMEWVDGPTLAEHLRGAPVTAATLAERLRYVEHLATAVASLHSHTRSAGNPVLHRDLTPANCIVHATRGIVLIDISGMWLVDDGFDPLGRHTPAYAAPEVLRAPHEPRHPSSDLYAVGAVAVFVLTGADPGPGLPARLPAVLRAAGARSPEAAAEHLLTMLTPDPAQRPSDVLGWSRTLSTLAAPARAPRRRRLALGGTAALLAAGLATAGGAYTVQHRADTPGPPRTTASPPASTADTLGPVRAATDFSPVDFRSSAGRFTSLASGARVRDCEVISGTAAPLPPGQTLVVTQHNEGGGDTIRFMQVTWDFKQPQKLTRWRTAHYFNEQAVGQDMLMELIRVPLTPALVKADDDQRYDLSSALVAKGTVIAAVTVVHEDKHNPDWPCPA